MSLVVPAILPATHKELDDALAILVQSPDIARIQIDVVDGKLATPASWPYSAPTELERLRSDGYVLPHTGQIEYEIDLMTLDAGKVAGYWLALGASRLTFHIESVLNEQDSLQNAHRRYSGGDIGMAGLVTFGLAVNVNTDLAVIEPLVGAVSYIQCMGIARIGRQGEVFDARAIDQVKALRRAYPHLPIQVDGGVTLQNAKLLLAAGAENLVVGSAILRAKDPLATIAAFEALQNPFGV